MNVSVWQMKMLMSDTDFVQLPALPMGEQWIRSNRASIDNKQIVVNTIAYSLLTGSGLGNREFSKQNAISRADDWPFFSRIHPGCLSE